MTDLSIARERRQPVPDNYSFVQGEFQVTIVSDGYITVPIDIDTAVLTATVGYPVTEVRSRLVA